MSYALVRLISLSNCCGNLVAFNVSVARLRAPLELHLTTSELWFGQEQEGILP